MPPKHILLVHGGVVRTVFIYDHLQEYDDLPNVSDIFRPLPYYTVFTFRPVLFIDYVILYHHPASMTMYQAVHAFPSSQVVLLLM